MDSRSPAAGRTHAVHLEMVTMPSRDKPLPLDSTDRAGKVRAALAVADAAVEGAGAALRVGRKELLRCGAGSA